VSETSPACSISNVFQAAGESDGVNVLFKVLALKVFEELTKVTVEF